MLLADGGITFVLIGAVFLVGLAIVTALRAIFRGVMSVCGLLFGCGCRQRTPEQPSTAGGARLCPHPRCGHVNRGEARYCARCGTTLGPMTDVDRYG